MHTSNANMRGASSKAWPASALKCLLRAALAQVTLRCLAALAVAAALASSADAELFKCTGADGRILYSDSPCPTGSRSETIQPNDNSPLAAKAPAPPEDVRLAPPVPAGKRSAQVASRYELSVNERQRVANLEQVQRAADNDEKRQAARMEIQEIQRGTMARMSYEDLRRKDGYWIDLGNLDPKRRQAAVQQLADLFAAHQSGRAAPTD